MANESGMAQRMLRGDSENSTSRCHCFDTCTLPAIAHFLTHFVPSAVTAATPMWLSYLKSVYHEQPPLPFNMSRNFNFFYHRDARWAAAHPSVEWPMATCTWKPGDIGGNHIGLPNRSAVLAPGQERCSANYCAKWQAEAAASSAHGDATLPQPHRPPVTHAFLMPGLPRTLVSGGAVLFGDRYAQFVPDHSPLEVMRMQTRNVVHDLPIHSPSPRVSSMLSARMCAAVQHGSAGYEGTDGGGCWLLQASGSGVWVNVGRSFRAESEDRLKHPSAPFNLAWAKWKASDHGRHNSSALHMQRIHKERYPSMAHAMGYTSLQMGATHYPWHHPHAQVVMTPEQCMAQATPIRACLPLETRAGWKAQLNCTCIDGDALMLECTHVGPVYQG